MCIMDDNHHPIRMKFDALEKLIDGKEAPEQVNHVHHWVEFPISNRKKM